jgi:hypothetical protein
VAKEIQALSAPLPHCWLTGACSLQKEAARRQNSLSDY